MFLEGSDPGAHQRGNDLTEPVLDGRWCLEFASAWDMGFRLDEGRTIGHLEVGMIDDHQPVWVGVAERP
jgi:hypothetical protein